MISTTTHWTSLKERHFLALFGGTPSEAHPLSNDAFPRNEDTSYGRSPLEW